MSIDNTAASSASQTSSAPRASAAAWLRNVWRSRRPSPLFEALARDRLLLASVVVLGLVTLVPMFVTPFLPLADLPANAAQGALLPSILFDSKSLAAYHYKIQWAPVPYWSTHLLVALLAPVFGGLLAAKMLVAVVVLGFPLAIMRVLVALGRDPRLGVWAFLLSWDHNVYAGWNAYMLGMTLALVGVAWLMEAETPRAALRVAVLSAVIAVTHVQAVAYFGLTCVALALIRRPLVKALWIHAIACSGFVLTVVPWLVGRWTGQPATHVPFSFELPPLSERLASFFKYTLDNQPKPEDTLWTGCAFLLLLFGAPLLASLPQADKRSGDDAWRSPAGAAAVLVGVPLLLYLVLPMTISGPISHWYTYPRYATIALGSLLLLPRASFKGTRALWLLPGALCAIVCQLRVAAQFADFGQRARPFLEIIAHVRPNSAYLPLELDDYDTATKLPPFNQIHSYIAAVKQGYDPHLFDNDAIPVLYRQERRLPQTQWNAPEAFTLQDHGRFYDYVVVQGLRRDPLARLPPAGKLRAKLVVEAGRFRLYEILKG